MKAILRYFVLGVVAAVVFVIAAVAIFVAVFDANAYKQDLSDLVREQTGRDLQFHGDVSLTVFPALGMKLGAMSFSNPPAFGSAPMVKVSEASISVDLASLISLSPEIEKLVLRDLEVNLIKNKAGVTNWDDLVKPSAETASASGQGASSGESGGKPDFEIQGAFGGLDLQNIRLSWVDEQSGESVRINDLDLTTGRIVPNQSFPLKLYLDASASGDLDVIVDFETRVGYLIEQQRLTLEDLVLKLNEFNLTGSLEVSDFNKPTPTLRFDLASESIDVDALLGTPPADPEAPPAQPPETGSAADTRIQLPMQLLRDLDIDGRLGIASIKFQNLLMSAVNVVVKAENGIVGVNPVSLKTYDGEVEVAVVIDATGEVPKYRVDKMIDGIQIGDLLKDYTGKDSVLGTVKADVALTTGGEWLSELKRNSNGNMALQFTDGAIQGFNLRHAIDKAEAKFKGEEPPAGETLKTDFSALNVSGRIRNGVFSSDDLDLQAPLLRVGGAGQADLADETVDYLVQAKLVGTVAGQQGGAADDLKGLEIPVRIRGPFSAPDIDVRLDEMLKARLAGEKAKLKAELEAEKAKLKAEAEAEKARLKAEIEAEKKALEAQIEAEKKALEEARKRELEKKKAVEKAKAKAKLEKKKEELLKKLTE